jgi:hypothetical protein
MPDNVSVEQQLEEAKQAVGWLSGELITYAVIALAVLVLLYIAYKALTGRKKKPVERVSDLGVDVDSLGSEGPPAGATELEFYNLPVRLAAVVLAPAGRIRSLPPPGQLDNLYDAIVPGLSDVVATHKPLIRRWSAQLSVKGFAHVVFQRCQLPGDGGKGTPWATIAGVFEFEGQPMVAGLILRSESSNSHGQRIVDAAHAWLDCLRVKG